MKSLKITIGAIALIAMASIAAFSFNVLFTSAPPDSMKNIKIDLKGAAYTDDHAMVEFSVNGEILTPDGPLTECPVGGVKLLNTSGEEMAVSNQDFVFCRPDGNGGYLITQFMYGDFSSENKKPKKVKIKIGDVNFTANDGQIAKVNVIGYKEITLPEMKDMDSVSYPSSTAEAASGLKMKIKRVDYSPSLAKVDACLTLPNLSVEWLFDDAYLLVGDQKVPFEYWTIPNYDKPGILENQERCYSVIVTDIPDYKTFRKGDVSFVIEKISRYGYPECVDATDWEKIKDEFDKYEVPFSDSGDGGYCFGFRDLSGEVNAHMTNYIKDALKEEIAGPLVIPLK